MPAAVVDSTLDALLPRLGAGDVVVDGGNSYYRDDIARAARLGGSGLHYVDCGTSGGVVGLDRGYCLMIGGEPGVIGRLDPLFASLAPGAGTAPRTPGRESLGGTSEQGYLHCGPTGAGHFVKMVHNGIEYGMMAAYAEGLNILRHANVGKQQRDDRRRDHAAAQSRVLPVRLRPRRRDRGVASRQRGRVVAPRPHGVGARGRSDARSGSPAASRTPARAAGRSTPRSTKRCPAHVLAAALFERFSSRGEADFQDRVLSAMRFEFGGHVEKGAGG